jgi:hypothetical protein
MMAAIIAVEADDALASSSLPLFTDSSRSIHCADSYAVDAFAKGRSLVDELAIGKRPARLEVELPKASAYPEFEEPILLPLLLAIQFVKELILA